MPRKSTRPRAIIIGSGCRLEALVPIDERGQIVLPKKIRDKADIKPGDKLAAVTCEKDGRIYCITLVKADEFKDTIRKTIGPMLEELAR